MVVKAGRLFLELVRFTTNFRGFQVGPSLRQYRAEGRDSATRSLEHLDVELTLLSLSHNSFDA